MKKILPGLAALGFLITALIFFTSVPARAENIDEQISALEQELAQLKAEQARMKEEQLELRNEATAAAAALPSFRYRRGGGLLIEDANGSWGIRFFTQFQYHMGFYLDDNRSQGGSVQGALQPRRIRPRFNYYWDKGFHEFDFWVDISNGGGATGGSWNAFKANYAAHFEDMSPWLPTLWVGANPSFFMNSAGVNVSSSSGPRNDYSFLTQGNGIILATQTRGIVLNWRNLPLGMMEGQFNLGYSIFGQDAFAQLSSAGVKNDNKAFSMSLELEPFAKVKNKWLRGLALSYGMKLQNMSQDNESGYNLRTNQLRQQRVSLIRTAARDDFWEFYTVGVKWRVGPYAVYVSGDFDNSHRETGNRADEGNGIRGRSIRIMHELFVWSRKGPLTGSARSGGISVAPLWERVEVRAPNAMTGCAPVGGGCQGAYAVNSGIGVWYYPGNATNFGVVWDHYRVNKANSDVSTRIKRNTQGRHVDFNTVTLIMRATW